MWLTLPQSLFKRLEGVRQRSHPTAAGIFPVQGKLRNYFRNSDGKGAIGSFVIFS
jgi:hypothetical protein